MNLPIANTYQGRISYEEAIDLIQWKKISVEEYVSFLSEDGDHETIKALIKFVRLVQGKPLDRNKAGYLDADQQDAELVDNILKLVVENDIK